MFLAPNKLPLTQYTLSFIQFLAKDHGIQRFTIIEVGCVTDVTLNDALENTKTARTIFQGTSHGGVAPRGALDFNTLAVAESENVKKFSEIYSFTL